MIEQEGEQFAWTRATGPQGLDARMENPRLQMPLVFVLDDPAPLRNPMYFARAMRKYVEVVPNSFMEAFAAMVERTGMRGKFSVLPNPLGLGRIDRGMVGVSAAELGAFLAIVRERIMPRFDITPEMLTHWNAIDLATDRLLPYWEHDWSRRQTRETLTPYIALGLEILNNVGLPAGGVTSPWDFGHGVEDEYVPAILEAQRRVNGRDLTWYFLDTEGTSRYAPPRVMYLNAEEAAAVVSVPTGVNFDFAWRTQDDEPATTDRLITADGASGRLVDLARAGSPLVFHSHWQSLFSNGSAAGLAALEVAANRLGEHLGEAAHWATCSDVARLAATGAALDIDASPAPARAGGQQLTVTSPFDCPAFTLSLGGLAVEPDDVRTLTVAGRPLARHAGNGRATGPLAPGTWMVREGRVYACWDLQKGATELAVAAAP